MQIILLFVLTYCLIIFLIDIGYKYFIMMRLPIMWETAYTGSFFIGHLNAGNGDTEKKPLK